jgi:hypothetical protein
MFFMKSLSMNGFTFSVHSSCFFLASGAAQSVSYGRLGS